MRKWFLLLLLGGVLLMVPGCMSKQELRKATWLWDATQLHEPHDVVSFLKKHHFNTVFVQIDEAITQQTYAQFIAAASEEHIAVYALDGAASWATEPEKSIAFFQWLERYTAEFSDAPFTGIHVDVEPYLHPEWQNDEAYVVEQFQQFLTDAKTRAEALALPLEADLPFWFDEVTFHNDYGEGNVAQWAIELLDGVTLMAYRDDAQSIITITKNEVSFAKKAGTPLTIGIETMQSDEGQFVSFYGRSEAYITAQLDAVQQYYRDENLQGVAWHHYDTIKQLMY